MTPRRAEIIKDRLDKLAAYSDLPDCLCREFGSTASDQVNHLVAKWMSEAGLEVRIDNIGNVRGFRDNGKSKIFLMGSHLDTVIDAGKFDGPLGVLMAIDQAQHIDFTSFPYDLEIAGFSNEEGLRFPGCYLGSTVVAGCFQEDWLKFKDRNQISLEQAISSMGGNPMVLTEDATDLDKLAGYLEVHIEQGPVLESHNYPLGVVNHISAQQRYILTINGVAGHAGTVPMDDRKDALAGASELILEVEKTAKQYPPMVATVGYLEVNPGTTNVIPGRVQLTIDIRSPHKNDLAEAILYLKGQSGIIADTRGLTIEWDQTSSENPIECDPSLSNQLEQACSAAGHSYQVLPSGAGHDAIAIAKVAPVCMLFVRCKNGISHNPLEEAAVDDIAAAIDVCDHFFNILKLN